MASRTLQDTNVKFEGEHAEFTAGEKSRECSSKQQDTDQCDIQFYFTKFMAALIDCKEEMTEMKTELIELKEEITEIKKELIEFKEEITEVKAEIKAFKEEIKADNRAFVKETMAENQAYIEKLQDDDPDYEENKSGQDLDYDSKDNSKPNDQNDDGIDDITYEGNTSKENPSLNGNSNVNNGELSTVIYSAETNVNAEVILIQENESISNSTGYVFKVFQDLRQTTVTSMLYFTDEIDKKLRKQHV
jgi:chromosome segregation ATPase